MLQAKDKKSQNGPENTERRQFRLLRGATEQELRCPQSLPAEAHLSGNSLSAAKTALTCDYDMTSLLSFGGPRGWILLWTNFRK